MCSVAFESMIQEFGKLIFEALNAWEIRDLLASANEQAPEGFSNVPSKLLSFSISYLLNSPVSWELSSPGWVVKRWACSWLLCCSPLLFRFFSWPGFFTVITPVNIFVVCFGQICLAIPVVGNLIWSTIGKHCRIPVRDHYWPICCLGFNHHPSPSFFCLNHRDGLIQWWQLIPA